MKIRLLGFCLIVFWGLSVAAQTRLLTIVSEPNASVWVDDVYYGKTDTSGKLKLRTFMTGTHKLRVRADGFKEVSQNLLATQKGEIKVPLTKTNDEAELAFQQAEAASSVDREKAVALYEKAVKLRPKYAEAYLGMARVLLAAGDTQSALTAIQNARKARPAYAEASAVEGRIYKEIGDEEKALASFKRAITEGKGFQPEALTGLGLFYREKAEGFAGEGDFDSEKENYLKAAAELRKAATQLSGSPDAVTIFQLLGDSYERAKMFPQAIKVYEEFLQIFPDANEAEMFRSFIVQARKQMNGEQ
jgi:tetratricopeptide (TPR) repeat protein